MCIRDRVNSGLVSASNPIWIQTGFGEAKKIKKITYLSRDNGMGSINAYKVQMCIRDSHNCVYGNKNDKLYKAIQAEMPDMILIGGDMLVAKEGSSVQEALEFVKKLPHICQVYYTNGNHEQRMKENTDIYGDTYERYKAKLENCGVCFLENKAENIEKNGMKFSIYGLERCV